MNRLSFQNMVNDRNLIILAIGLRVAISVIDLLTERVNPYMTFSYEALTYIIICSLVVLNRHKLEDYFVDRPTIILIILGGSLLRIGLPGIPIGLEMFIFLGAIFWLFLKLRKSTIVLNRPSANWFFLGSVTGILGGLIILPLYANKMQIAGNIDTLLITTSLGLMISLSHGAMMEEPIFRGFLWGYLKNQGWKGQYILLFQALLFWLVHINYISKPVTFWITVPLSGLVLGGLAWKTKSIAPAILAHTIYNTFVYLMQNGVI